MVQDERRRINTIDNPTYLDTVEVIGSIPVAPTFKVKIDSPPYKFAELQKVKSKVKFSGIFYPA